MTSLAGLKVVTAKEMARVEALAYQAGYKEIDFMKAAGEKVGMIVERYLSKHKKSSVTLLIGKGNNGGDGFVAGLYLLEKGFSVTAYHLFGLDESSPLCKLFGEIYLKTGAPLHYAKSAADISFEQETVIIDALLGTGFKGELKSPLLELVQKANVSKNPLFSIDIPSGLDAGSGIVKNSAVKALETVFLGLPKMGFFINDGFNHVGKLGYGDFGLPQEFSSQAEFYGNLIDESKIAEVMPEVKRTRHKYEAGYVLGFGGSKGMTGALKLSGLGALRTGAGIVKLFYPPDAEMENSHSELICNPWNYENLEEEKKRARALFVGPGMGRSERTFEFLKKELPQIDKPCVIDADGLFFLSKFPQTELPKETIITPHMQEMARLIPDAPKEPLLFHRSVMEYAKRKNVTVVLKGAPTFVFSPGVLPLIIPRGDPGMATAGTGDVLTGMIAALLSGGLSTYHAAIVGVYIHALAGEKASRAKTSYGVIASDLIEKIPSVLKQIIKSYERR